MAHKLLSLAIVTATAALLLSCNEDSAAPADSLAAGTWGGDDAGLVVGDATAHLHIGCTFGDFPAHVTVDDDGHFTTTGEYVLRAFPVQVGPTLPAEFTGVVSGNTATILVTVNDTIDRRIVIKGPVMVKLGREPKLGPCPICNTPKSSASD